MLSLCFCANSFCQKLNTEVIPNFNSFVQLVLGYHLPDRKHSNMTKILKKITRRWLGDNFDYIQINEL